jgi:hypothetical protein
MFRFTIRDVLCGGGGDERLMFPGRRAGHRSCDQATLQWRVGRRAEVHERISAMLSADPGFEFIARRT